MKLGIMQPYYFPYIGYFALIAHTDEWIVFDITQYTPKSWMNRNRVLHPHEGWNYISAPLQHTSISLMTHEARVQDVPGTGKSLIGKLTHYRKQAPHYQSVIEVIESAFANVRSDSLVDVNVAGMQAVCNYLGMPFNFRICSELNLPLPSTMHPGGWAPAICKLLGADAYLNPPGGKDLFDPEEFAANGVALEFLGIPEIVYPTGNFTFEPYLSILDVMMWNSPAAIMEIIKSEFSLERIN